MDPYAPSPVYEDTISTAPVFGDNWSYGKGPSPLKDNFTYQSAPLTAGQTTQMAGAGIGGLGSLIGAYASYQAGKAERERARANAEVMRLDALEALKQGEQSAQEVGKQANQVVGAQASSYAAQGVKTDTGSAAMVAEQSLQAAGVDVLRLRREARKHADNLYRQAGFMEQAGEDAYSAGRLNAWGQGIAGVGSVATGVAGAMI